MAESERGIILGTRGSELARTQTRMVQEALAESGWTGAVEVKIISTTGDRRQDLRLSSPELDKAVFTKELEEALLGGQIDAAVHSLKDVPTMLESAFQLVAVLPRAPVEDVLVTRDPAWVREGLASLPKGSTVATSSLRRSFQLRDLRPDLNLTEIRGNVPTRLRKVATQAGIDATILARAGLERLGYEPSRGRLELPEGEVGFFVLDPSVLLPAAGQGAVAVEIRTDDPATSGILQRINHDATWKRIQVERAYLRALGASCQTPVGVHTVLEEDGETIRIDTVVYDEQSGAPRRSGARGPGGDGEAIARQLMEPFS